MPGDRVELAAVAEEGRLLDRHLVDQPFDERAARERIGRSAEERTMVEARRRSAERCAQRGLLRDGERDPDLAAHELGDLAERVLHEGTAIGAWRSVRRRSAISSGDMLMLTPASSAAFGIP